VTEQAKHEPTIRRTYRDRLGRPITDPAGIEMRYVQEQLRRLTTRNLKAYPDRPWYAAVTVGELAKATKRPTGRIIQIVRDEMYLGIVTETDGPVEDWGLGEDGE
jgi:hypothetical protein